MVLGTCDNAYGYRCVGCVRMDLIDIVEVLVARRRRSNRIKRAGENQGRGIWELDIDDPVINRETFWQNVMKSCGIRECNEAE